MMFVIIEFLFWFYLSSSVTNKSVNINYVSYILRFWVLVLKIILEIIGYVLGVGYIEQWLVES
jgi:hypothetical protein